MRIAFSGTHRVGKSTLAEQVADVLHDHAVIEEPYCLLEDDGYEFADPPSVEDFEAQLERSLELFEEGTPNVLFDRSPADVVSYLLVRQDAASFDEDQWLDRIHDAMQTLDLVVFVPVEKPDRIAVGAHEDRELRLAVHEKLEELIVDRSLRFDTEVIVASGNMKARVERVLTRIEEKRGVVLNRCGVCGGDGSTCQ